MTHLTYLQAIFIGALQGVTELFPVSSLGHSVLIPALIGGSWADNLSMTATASPYLAFLVAVHVATAIALVIFFRHDWVRIIIGLVTSIRDRRISTTYQRLAWLLIIATIPVGIAGIALDHLVRTTLGRPVPAATFLIINGVVLLAVERLRGRRDSTVARPVPVGSRAHGGGLGQVYAASGYMGASTTTSAHDGTSKSPIDSDERLARLGWIEGTAIGAAQILALLPGISRSGSTIVAGLIRGLTHEDAARFAFLLATPAIAGAGVFKLPELAGPTGHGILGQVLAGSLVAGVGAYLSLRFLTRYFQTRTLTPFAVYCMVGGIASLVWLIAT
ncbi:undecaprenyl-diphosphate phosphatase [Rugosimonospora africana]|uniref:Undecaprenyl-diphosphatase n=1 Tax=Rugosimonospora africana TaxID=556532 RepID=A0A8J3QUI0_9ACTN|nr:undecaprenyl-diphosphate phosphatase [Rugosimonospora africana]GIH15968.1 undecaprenyl-diphosphatase [Rugosimonospora africana]